MAIFGLLQAIGDFEKESGVVIVPVIFERVFVDRSSAAPGGFHTAGNKFEGFVKGGKVDLVLVDAFLGKLLAALKE